MCTMDSQSPEQLVYETLQYACSQNPDLIKQAEQKIAEWEICPGFYKTLVNIFSNHQADVNVRWMAVVCLKTGVSKYWRKHSRNEIEQSEKTEIRNRLISSFNEPVPQVATQIASVIAKIARMDCPKEWPGLIPVLVEAVRNTTEMEQHRALLVLQHVIKELSSRRMMADKRTFEEITTNIYSFILNLWDGFTTLFFQSLQREDSSPAQYLEKALLCLRIMRKLTIYGIHKPHDSANCMLFLNAIFRSAKQCLECRFELKQRNTQHNLIEMMEKFTLKQMKILNEFLELHPLSFVNLISTALEFSFNYIFHTGTSLIYDGNVISFTNFAIQCVNLMKGILSTNAYNSYVIENVSLDINIPAALAVRKEFFTAERLNYICEKIIMHYFLLMPSDLDQWMNDPESYASDEGGESWKYALRPCMETFFLTLFNAFKEPMMSEVLKYVRKAQQITLTADSDLKDILLKDAIYNAAGLTSVHYYDEIDYDAWFTNQLSQEIRIGADNFRIIRRRAIWMISQWAYGKFSSSLRPEFYSACLSLLQSREDMAVRLAASKTLMTLVDDFQFEPLPFLTYLEPCFSSLFILLKEANECETKMNVLCTMSLIVDKMSDHIQAQADNLITYLPMLWKESEDHNMLRCAIISTLLQIVRALCTIPPNLAPFLYPVIEISTDIKQPSHIYLMEEGLELWLAVVENSTSLSPQLLDLCNNLLPIIEMSSENLRTVLFIIEAYILLSPEVFLQRFGKNVVSTCAYMLTDMRSEGIVVVMKLFEAYLRSEPNLGLELLKPVLPYIFKQVYANKEYVTVMSMYLTVVARVLILNQNAFIEALQQMNEKDPLETILDVWIDKMPLVTQPDKRKLLSLALGSILTVNENIVYERFGGILQNIYESLYDIMKEDEDGGSPYDSLVFTDETEFESSSMRIVEDFENKTYHYERCRQLCLKDPVHRIVLKDYVQSQINNLRENLGSQRFETLMRTVDANCLSNLAVFVNVFIATPKATE